MAGSTAPPPHDTADDAFRRKAVEQDSPRHSAVNWPVFIGASAIIVAFVAWAAIWPSAAETAIFGSMAWIAENFGWYYVLTVTVVVVFVIVVALSRVGQTRMGPDHPGPSTTSSRGRRCSSPRASASI